MRTRLEDRVYEYLLTVRSVVASTIVDVLDALPEEVASALAALEHRGLVSRSAGLPPAYLAAPPHPAVQDLLFQRQRELRWAQEQLANAVAVYRGAAARSASDIVEVIADKATARARVLRAHNAVEHDFMALSGPPFSHLSLADSQDNSIRVDHSARIVFDQRILKIAGAMTAISAENEDNAEYRMFAKVPMRLAIYDRELALVADVAANHGPPVVLVVHGSPLLEALICFFEHIWDQATPLRATANGVPSAPTALSPQDRQLLSLLLGGSTDQSVALQLGVGLRSVQRRVRQLMDLAGVHTRIQLGWHARDRQWLDELPASGFDEAPRPAWNQDSAQ